MPAVTANELCGTAFTLLNVFLPGEAVPAADANTGRTFLNLLLSLWRQQAMTIPIVARERFDMIADRGGPTNPYTVGPGGTINTTPRPPNQHSVTAANLILTATDPEVRVPLAISTTQAAFANQVPGLSSSQPTAVFYNPTYASDLGSLYLWPVPDTAENDLELFLQKPLASFDDGLTTYYVPDGADTALSYNLAELLSVPYGRELPPAAVRMARLSLGIFERSNLQVSDLPNDARFGQYRTGLYNIHTGNY